MVKMNNGKLRAKRGRIKARKKFGTLYPRHNAKKALLRAATNTRIMLERERESFIGARVEETDANSLFCGGYTTMWKEPLPSVRRIMHELAKQETA